MTEHIKIYDIKIAKPIKDRKEFEERYKPQIEHYKKIMEENNNGRY